MPGAAWANILKPTRMLESCLTLIIEIESDGQLCCDLQWTASGLGTEGREAVLP